MQHDERGIEVNDYLQTSQRHIYAAGDVANRLKFTCTADFTARAVVRNILMPLPFLRQKLSCAVVPWCTSTDPEVAHVGLGEKQATKEGIVTICSLSRWPSSIALSWKTKMQDSRKF